jgi:hypothetical protein
MPMAVHRISDRAEAALQRLAKKAGQKPSQFLHDRILDFEAGEEFTPPDQRTESKDAEEAGQ